MRTADSQRKWLESAVLLCVLLLIVALALWWTSRPDGRFHLIMPAIPGDGILLIGVDGQTALIDGGTDGVAVATWLGDTLPLGQRRIDLLLLTRADDTTLPGQLAAARRYQIRQAVLAQPDPPQPEWDELVRLLRAQGTPVHLAVSGDRLRFAGAPGGGAAEFAVLNATEGRLTLAMTIDRQQVVLLHSLGDEPLPQNLPHGPISVLFYPWQRTPRDPALESLAPLAIVYGEQAGDDPQATLAERRIGDARLFHETLDGSIDLIFDAQGVSITTSRQRTE